MEQTNTETKRAAVAYVPFASFCTALDHLNAHGVPSKIDSSVFPSFSGGLTSHLLLSMRFLGLIDDRGAPTSELPPFLDEKTRKQAFAGILPRAYSALFRKVDLAKASPSQLDAALREQGVTGATGRKAKAFLLKAAQYAGLPVSAHLLKRTRATGARRSVVRKSKQEPSTDGQREKPREMPLSVFTKTIRLPQAGGMLMLTGDFDPFSLRGAERDLVYRLADEMSGFESESGSKEES